ncbi:MAG: type II toxin-antitoxin system PemK/MazF family toxin [Anaerolineales bacterium]
MTVNLGDIYWIPVDEANDLKTKIVHPHVVIQVDAINHTLMVCALTTNKKQANLPGNVLLEAGEANLPKQSIVVVSQAATVNKSQLGEYIGSLTEERLTQILSGMRFVQRMIER